MKSKTWSFNLTAFRKDITRFVPLWLVYFIGGLLVMLSVAIDNTPHSLARSLGKFIGTFAPINMVYAFLCAVLLFGDLFHTRLCNAVHAMPMRREHWFWSHAAAGLCFSVVPNALGVLWMIPMLGRFWFVSLLWLLGMTLHFLFFFGLAVLCCQCTGSRFAAGAMYSLLNFFAPIAGWFANVIYLPQLYGVPASMELTGFCPVMDLNAGDYLIFEYLKGPDINREDWWHFGGLSGDWWYLLIVAVAGLALLAAALLIYRRRKLEYAGDFLAVKKLEPLFSLLLTLSVGVIFAGIGELFINSYLVFLLAGLTIGFFAGQMMLRRTVRVFRLRTFVAFGVLTGVLLGSIWVTRMDPLGITRWLPEADNVASVTVSASSYSAETVLLERPEDIDRAIQIHSAMAEAGERAGEDDEIGVELRLTYTMKDKTSVTRAYPVRAAGAGRTPQEEAALAFLREIFSRPENVLIGYQNREQYLSCVADVTVSNKGTGESKLENSAQCRALVEAVLADCEAGTMAQNWHLQAEGFSGYGIVIWRVTADNYAEALDIQVGKDCVNTLKWLEENLGKE